MRPPQRRPDLFDQSNLGEDALLRGFAQVVEPRLELVGELDRPQRHTWMITSVEYSV
jgi:hypothetical protein